MNKDNENYGFFGYEGVIGRKNYFINSAILVVLFILLCFINISKLQQYTQLTFLYYVLDFVIGFGKFFIVFSLISLIYRRLADITFSKSDKIKKTAKIIFSIFYIYPIIAYCIGPLLDVIQGLNTLLLYSIIIILPFALLMAFVLLFIKGNLN